MSQQTIRVDFTASLSDLVALLLHDKRYTPLDELPTFSRAGEIRDAIRDALCEYGLGEHIGYWYDHCAERECDARTAWAKALVIRAYPNFDK